jgi:hypothetical protein
VSTPASGGVVDLLRGQPGAWIAPEIDADALAATLLAALAALESGARFQHCFVDQFGLENAIHSYEAAIDAVLQEGRH